MNLKNTLVIGASEKPERYSYKAIMSLLNHNHPVFAIGNKKGKVSDVDIITDKVQFENIDTVTLYLNPDRQKEYYDYILSLKPKRIIFNPGTENDEFENLASKNNIQILEACTLVLLSTGQY